MNLIAEFVGLIAAVIMILSVQVKSKKQIYLIMNVSVQFLFALNFFLIGGYSGSIIGLINGIESIIVYVYNRNNKEVPKSVIIGFILTALICGIVTYTNIYSLMPMLCGVLNVMIIISKNMKNIRRLTFIVSSVWCIYDAIILAYVASVSSAFLSISTIIGMIRYDLFKNKKIEQCIEK